MAQMTNETYLDNVKTGLTTQLTVNKEALPQGFNRDRFILNSITVIQDMLKDSKKKDQLQKLSIDSVAVCLAKGAFLGLDFFNGECYAIPYNGTMKFQTDYKGEIKLCKRYSKTPIKDIYAKVVREGDFFEEEIDTGTQSITFRPVPFSTAPMIGAFAIVVYQDGSMLYETMSAEEIEKVRNTYSKAKDSDAWTKSPGEMYRKTVLRRLCKFIDLDFDTVEQAKAYEDGGDSTFDAKVIAANKQDALPNHGEPVDVFSQIPKEKREAPMITQEELKMQEDFERFEKQLREQEVEEAEIVETIDAAQEELPFK